jgi:hypothetical protein
MKVAVHQMTDNTKSLIHSLQQPSRLLDICNGHPRKEDKYTNDLLKKAVSHFMKSGTNILGGDIDLVYGR